MIKLKNIFLTGFFTIRLPNIRNDYRLKNYYTHMYVKRLYL